MRTVSKAKAPPAPKKPPRTAKAWKTSAELEQLLAERSGEAVVRVSVFGEADNWNAALIVPLTGNAERLARFRTIVAETRRKFDLRPE